MTFQILVTLRSNLKSPLLHDAFETGVEGAIDRLSIPIKAVREPAAPLRSDELLTFELVCGVILIYVDGDEDETVRVIDDLITEAESHGNSAQLLVAIPVSSTGADTYFRAKLPNPIPNSVSIEGIDQIETFSKVVELYLAHVSRGHLPASETIGQAQAELEAAAQGERSPANSLIFVPGSLS